MMDIETPDAVSHRVFHEEEIRPGSICRRYHRDEDDEWTPTPWFAVVTTPQQSNHGSEYIRAIWLDGENAGQRERFFLGDLGVKPPYRGVTEKHDLEIPERYIASSYPARVLAGLAGRLFE